jgi:hypothetical protein
MGGVPQGQEVSALVPEVDLAARVVYFPVRHHSPACAWHVTRLIAELKPDAVLIEGPRDATSLIPYLLHEKTRTPVAIYTTYVQREGNEIPRRFAAYYPMCDYSPELAAIRAAAKVGARTAFIDLTYPEMVVAEKRSPNDKARNLLGERYFKHSRFLKAACRKVGARDPDDLWDHLYEVDYERIETADFMRNVLGYCAMGRRDYTPEMVAEEAHDVREAAMAAAIAAEKGRVLVVTGGFHTVALPTTAAAMPPKVDVAKDDAQVVLMRYGFEQLDRLNGYASGMPSPEFYQRRWEGREPGEIVVELGRQLREKNIGTVADGIVALDQARRLAGLRGHGTMSREDLLDGVRSAFVKGSLDIEGVLVLAAARKLLAGERIGDVPAEAGQPPLLDDFRRTAARLRVDLDRVDAKEVALDLYRKVSHREVSRFFHRLKFLEVPFADWVKGPDFVSGEGLERIQEIWKYRWSPNAESALIEKSLYGSSLEEAAAALALERFRDNLNAGQGRRADLAAKILLEACRMGLHRQTQDLLNRTRTLVGEDGSFMSLVNAMEQLMVLHFSREPLEAHHLDGISDVAAAAYDRACYLLPGLASTPVEEEERTLDALNALLQAVTTLGDTPNRRELRWDRLKELVKTTSGSATLRGAAVGALYGEGQAAAEEVVRHLQGHLLGARDGGAEGASFLRGMLRVARNVLWQVPEVLQSIHGVLKEWEEAHFVKLLPLLRLAFSDLTPRESDRVGKAVASAVGVAELKAIVATDIPAHEVLRGAEVNRRVLDLLKQDGLEAFGA